MPDPTPDDLPETLLLRRAAPAAAPSPTTDAVPRPSELESVADVSATLPHCAQPEQREAARECSASGLRTIVHVTGYEILGEVGRGGMGVVYKAMHLVLKRIVALKMIRDGGYADEAELARFRAEGEAVARLEHPNIVQIHEVGECDGLPYFALEFVDGGSLAQKLAGGALAPREAARLVETLAIPVQLAHSRNIVHRDLKPANVLLTTDGAPKIADFGLAKRLDVDGGQTQVGEMMGTPDYMAPEQASGRAQDAGPPADIYALGVILYECLTGRPPFKGDSVLDTLEQVRTREPARLCQLRRGTPRDLETICLKCLRKEPERRYASAQALAEDLRRWRQGEPIQARPVGGMERVAKWVRRNPALATVYGLLTAVLVLGGGGALWYKFDRDASSAKAERDKEAAERQSQLTEQAVRADLSEAALLRGQGAWAQATIAVERARGRVDAGGASDLAKWVQQASADLKVVSRLEEVQVGEAGSFNVRRAEVGYAAAFRDYGLALDEMKPEDAADLINASTVREQLIAALDDWIYIQWGHPTPGQVPPVELARLRDCVRMADDDPLRQQFRDLAEKQDGMELKRLAREPNVLDQPALTLVILGMEIGNADGAEEALLRRARTRYPNDFWVNYSLARILTKEDGREDEALGCYWTSLALRPQTQSIYCEINSILKAMGRTSEAADVAHKAVLVPSASPEDHYMLGGVLDDLAEFEEAIAEYQKAIDLKYAYCGDAHWDIALTRQHQGRREEARKEFDLAADAYGRASDQDPTNPRPLCDRGQALLRQGRFAEAIQNLQRGEKLAADQMKDEPSCRFLKVAQRLADLDAELPAALEGKPEPAATAALLAEIAQMPHRRLYAASGRLYARASSDNPQFIWDVGVGGIPSFYSAACASALAAAGQGADAGDLGPEERDRLRKQAVTWLRHALDIWAGQVDGGAKSAQLATTHWNLKLWQVNADLASLRDDAALAGLPQEDREACRKLWADVNALLDRTAPPQ